MRFPGIAQCHSLNNTSFSFIQQESSIQSGLIIRISVVELPNKKSEGLKFNSS